MLIGVDEVGLGPIAGPLVVCAFSAPTESWTIEGLNDSKKLSQHKREKISAYIHRNRAIEHVEFRMYWVQPNILDQLGVERALSFAMNKALEDLIDVVGVPHRVIIDGEDKKVYGAEFYPKADGKYPCVMAASVVAKVHRDNFMRDKARSFPGYGWEKNVGYPTDAHLSALRRLGVTPLHRRSYSPVKQVLRAQGLLR